MSLQGELMKAARDQELRTAQNGQEKSIGNQTLLNKRDDSWVQDEKAKNAMGMTC